ncbi:MAG: hypothetical protein IJ867_04685 [Clostridia bacterium]|nr:hypothetical protein [Clostridia bacterium]
MNNKIQERINDEVNRLLNKLELSLLCNAYPMINEYKVENTRIDEIEQLKDYYKVDLIKERMARINTKAIKNDIIKFDEVTSKKLLISLYEYYLREEMVEYTDFWHMNRLKESKEEPISEKFKDFLKESNNRDNVSEFDSTIKEILDNKTKLEDIYINRPTYFLLYRIRNNIINEVDGKICSENQIKEMVKNFKKKYRELYLKEYNKDFFNKIVNFEAMKKEICDFIVEELAEYVRSGKTVEIGNDLVNKFKEELQNSEQYNDIFMEYIQLVKIEDSYELLEKKTIEFQQKIYDLSSIYLDKNGKELKKYLENDLKNFLLYCTSHYIIDSINDSKDNIAQYELDKLETSIFQYINENYFTSGSYKIFMKIKNVELEEKDIMEISNVAFIKGKKIIDNFSESNNTSTSLFEKDFFEKEYEDDDDIFIIVNSIESLKGDVQFIEEKALERINSIMSIIHYYFARAETKEFELSDRMLIIGTDSDFRLVRFIRNFHNKFFNVKLDNAENINFVFENENNIGINRVLNSIYEYNKLDKEKVLNIGNLISANLKLVNEDIIYKSARFMTILIAGTNIFKYRVNYIQLRFWLLEDYLEFFNNKIPNDEFVVERFLNFYRRVINIIFSYSDLMNNNLYVDLQRWILKIFPNDYLSEGEDTYE